MCLVLSNKLSNELRLWNFTDVTLTDEDTNWILTDNDKTLPEAQRTQGIDFITWVNLTARIDQIYFSGTTWIGCKFGHQMAPLELVPNWSADGATCFSSKFGHQRAPLALVPSWRGNSSYGVNTLGPLCLWQCLMLNKTKQNNKENAKEQTITRIYGHLAICSLPSSPSTGLSG